MNLLRTLVQVTFSIALIILVGLQMTVFWFVMGLGMLLLPIITFGKYQLYTIDGKSYSLLKRKKNEDGWVDVKFNEVNNSSVDSKNSNEFEWDITEWGLRNIKSGQTIPLSFITISKEKNGVFIEKNGGSSIFIDANKIRNF